MKDVGAKCGLQLGLNLLSCFWTLLCVSAYMLYSNFLQDENIPFSMDSSYDRS